MARDRDSQWQNDQDSSYASLHPGCRDAIHDDNNNNNSQIYMAPYNPGRFRGVGYS